jgi:hypothetical protein
MRSLILSAGLLAVALVAASVTTKSGAVAQAQNLQQNGPVTQLVPIKAVPDDVRPSTLAPGDATSPQQGLSPTPEFQTRIKVAARCGTTNLYCNPPTPVCCGSPGKYYCARDASGCNQR